MRAWFSAVVVLGSGLVAACSAAHPPSTDAGPALDAAVPRDATTPADAGACEVCLAATITWGTDGGLACTRDSSSLAACRNFTFGRLAEACDPPDRVCNNELAACDASGTSVVARDVAAALAHPDVVAALAAAPVLYGTDPRAYDGAVFYVAVDGRRVEVGPDCTDPSCLGVPAGVHALQTLLEAVTVQQKLLPGCVEIFPGG